MRLIENACLCTMSALCGFLLLKFERDEPWPVGLLLAAAMILFIPFVRNRLEAYWPVSIAGSCILFAFMIGSAHDQGSGFKSDGKYRGPRYDDDQLFGMNDAWKRSIESDDEAGGVGKSIAGAAFAGESHPRIIVDYCRLDLPCWAKKYIAEATSACRHRIERLSKSPFEWTDGWLDEKFSKYRWKDREEGVITFIGDKFRSQTIFGGWQFQIYTCDYDPDTKVVMGVNSVPGRLPLDPNRRSPDN